MYNSYHCEQTTSEIQKEGEGKKKAGESTEGGPKRKSIRVNHPLDYRVMALRHAQKLRHSISDYHGATVCNS